MNTEYIKAFSVGFIDMDGGYEIECADCVLFCTDEEVEDKAFRIANDIGTDWNNRSYGPDREYDISPSICELTDEDVAWMIYKAENWYTGCVKEWLAESEYQYRKVESTIHDKWSAIVDREYCERILPLVQNLFRERGAAHSAHIR